MYILRRLVQLAPVLFLMSVLIFSMTSLLPGDPAFTILGEQSTSAQRERLREELGLNDPLPVRYVDWLLGVLRGDLGESLRSGEPVLQMLLVRLPVTLELTLLSMALAVAVGVPAGLVAATRRGSWADVVATFVSMFGVAIPYFWLGVLLILLFSLKLGWLPPSGYVPLWENPVENLKLMILPALTVGTAMAAIVMRQTRAAMLQILSQDYMRTARAKGLGGRVVIYKHGLRNALISVVTVVGLQIGALLGGAVVTETVFSLPGLGRMVVDGIFGRDFPAIQGAILFIVLVVLLVNLATDLIYAYLDPRIQL